MPAAFGGRTSCTRGEKFLPLAGIEAATSARQGAGFMPDSSRRCHRLRKRPAGRRLHSRTTAAVAIACASARQGAGFMPDNSRRCHRLRKRPAGRRLHAGRQPPLPSPAQAPGRVQAS